MLDECLMILLVDRYKHAQDVFDQVRTALGHTVQKNRLKQWLLSEIRIQFIEVVAYCHDPGHLLPQNNVPAYAGTDYLTKVLD